MRAIGASDTVKDGFSGIKPKPKNNLKRKSTSDPRTSREVNIVQPPASAPKKPRRTPVKSMY